MYTQIIQNQDSRICEKSDNYAAFSERHLQAMWLEQKYFGALTTTDDRSLVVHSPGIWNGEAGPDFLKADIEIGGDRRRGDIELHLSEEQWAAHGHHEDPRYNDVMLHVVLWTQTNRVPAKTVAGNIPPTTFVEPTLTIPLARITRLIDLDLYPYRRFVGAGNCAHSLFRSMSEKSAAQLFQSAATYRLERKREHLKAWVKEPQLRLHAGITMALGYKHNTRAFLDLFLWLQECRERGEEGVLAAAMGATGFFEERFSRRWENSEYYRKLRDLWWGMSHEVLHQSTLTLHQIRPLNHPVRRLAYLAKSLTDPRRDLLFDEFERIWRSGFQNLNPTNMRERLLGAIPDYLGGPFSSRYTFEEKESTKALPLIGGTLKKKILVNTLLPLLHEGIQERRNAEELIAFDAFYNSLSGGHSGKANYLVHRFFGDTEKGELMKRARIEQGAFQVHRDFCQKYEASCEGCPFVDRVKSLRGWYPRG